MLVETREWVRDALTAHEVTTLQAFRDLFAGATLRPGDEAGIGQVAILFTDLRGSTALYESIGDAQAFNLVREHFAVLGRVVRDHNGAVVKTIGDAVMAAFTDPAEAASAALAIREAILEFDRRLASERGGAAQRDANASARDARQIPLDGARHVGQPAVTRLRERPEIELHRLRFDQRRRIDWEFDRCQRHLRLAFRIEPRQLVRSPDIHARKRQRRGETECRTLGLARHGEQRIGRVVIRLAHRVTQRRLAERIDVEVEQRHRTRRMRAPSADSLSSIRS
jgi:hypothetical protein